jgi:hypothetical protein
MAAGMPGALATAVPCADTGALRRSAPCGLLVLINSFSFRAWEGATVLSVVSCRGGRAGLDVSRPTVSLTDG